MEFKTRKNPWSERFWKELLNASVKKNNEKAINEWELIHVQEGIEDHCICSKKILHSHIFKNKHTKKVLVVGSCCMRRFGVRMKWRSKKDYLFNAMYYAKDDWSKKFVKSLIDKEVKWGGRLKISKKQKKKLETITGKEWRWKCWKNKEKKQEKYFY